MEPQIIDYYNKYPHMINVIDRLNEEYSSLQNENKRLQKEINILLPILQKKLFEYSEKVQELQDDITEINEHVSILENKLLENNILL
mgnify:FL=1|tara:strand:+ start:292 stop:552 length:261 start_codon:yes stop_codon:yes gene_type:complete